MRSSRSTPGAAAAESEGIVDLPSCRRSAWWLVPGAVSLAVFAWLLALHPQAAGRTYAASGGV
jgi:drug/metabolite transporter superfamily protein YnfA